MRSKPGQDYLADFATIGAKPGCSPAELEAAWRRRVSDLHPDRARPGNLNGDTDARDVLAEINGAYRRLRDFQRRHGRMPGSPAAPGPRATGDSHWEPDRAPRLGGAGRTWLLALFNASLLGLLAILVWVLLERMGVRDRGGPGVRACVEECAPPVFASSTRDRDHLAPFRNNTTSTV